MPRRVFFNSKSLLFFWYEPITTAAATKRLPMAAENVIFSERKIKESKIAIGLYTQSKIAVRPAPRMFKLLKNKESAMAIPIMPLAMSLKLSRSVKFAIFNWMFSKKTRGKIMDTAIMDLKRFRAVGESFSPDFLKRITAIAQKMAQSSANIFPSKISLVSRWK